MIFQHWNTSASISDSREVGSNHRPRNNVFLVQRLSLRDHRKLLGGGRKHDHATPYINSLRWLKIIHKCNFDACLFIFKILNNCLLSWLVTINSVSDLNERMTRQLDNLYIPRTRTFTGERNLALRGSRIWNSLPADIKHSNSIINFKKKLKEHFLSQQWNISVISFNKF